MIKVYLYQLNKEYLKDHWDRALMMLPEWRREGCLRMKIELGRLQRLAAGLLLRHALKDAAGIDLNRAEIVKNEYGKPELMGKEIHFNLTDSDQYVAAVIADVPVGIDIETKNDPDGKIADRFFSPEEVKYIRSSETEDIAFRYIWTRKEAYLKCTGTGISVELSQVHVLKEREGAYLIDTPIQEPDYSMSLCVQNIAEEERFPNFTLDIVEGFDI